MAREPLVTFAELERARAGQSQPWRALRAALRFDADGLSPVVAQQHDSGEVLMLAWMNAEALDATLASGRAVYWSRSRACLWPKGDTSGHVQRLVELRVDCDGDALLMLVDQTGPACHTGRRSCFYVRTDGELAEIVTDPPVDPDTDREPSD